MNSPVEALTATVELGIVTVSSVDDMPCQFICIVVPVADIDHREGRIFFQNLFSAVFLSYRKRLVGIDFEIGNVEYLGGGIARVVNVFITG